MPPPFDGYAVPIKRALKPGETITLYNPEVAVESEALTRLKGMMRVDTPTICVAPGKYKIAYRRHDPEPPEARDRDRGVRGEGPRRSPPGARRSMGCRSASNLVRIVPIRSGKP